MSQTKNLAESHNGLGPHRRRLARIRCLLECVKCLYEKRALPESFCYVASEVEYKSQCKTTIRLFSEPKKTKKLTGLQPKELQLTSESRLVATGEEFCDSQGKWLKLRKYKITASDEYQNFDKDVWTLQYSNRSASDDSPAIVPVEKDTKRIIINSWEDVIEQHFSVQLVPGRHKIIQPEKDCVALLREIPPNWTLDHDESLVHLMSQHIPLENNHLGSIKNFVESVHVSTFGDDESGPSCLTDGLLDTYWESDGSQGNHWIRLKMKKGTVVLKLQLTIDGSDDNYVPSKIVVQGGEQDNQKTLNTIEIDREVSEVEDITILENMSEHFPVITINIKECKGGGIDTRVRGLKIQSSEGRYLGFDRDFFKGENLTRYPKLESYSPDQLYRRSQILQRFVVILDSVLQFIAPAWEYSVGSYSSLEHIRQLLPLSKKRLILIEMFLKESCLERPSEMPKLFINRRAAMEHRCDPSLDHEYKHSIFYQIYEGLKPKDRNSKLLNYRWSSRYDQWWECKFMFEGVIDQGGGFRDSLSDIAEELCPTSGDSPIPLPFFIRSPNQLCDDINVNRDTYIPNPACKEFLKYEWIGQLIGACMRGKENLILSLPSFVWKKLLAEKTTWSRDYASVDAAEVHLIDNLLQMKEDDFKALGRTWSMTQADGTLVTLKMDEDGNPLELKFEDREDYCVAVKEIRLNEFNSQIEAIKKGLLKVVPQAVLDLLTWQEVEHRVSGDPEITIDALKRSIHYDDLDENDTRVKYMWSALANFTNEDRSRFLRFITGRRRLPASVYIASGKCDAIDCLPESSTCANMLYLPDFTSAQVCEEKLHYAAYNCVDMDTDVNYMDD